MNIARLNLIPGLLLIGTTAAAGEWDLTGYAELNSRTFADSAVVTDDRSDAAKSLAVQTELYWQGTDGRLQFSGVAFGRADSEDDERTHLDLREANFGVTGNGWDVNAGVNKVFWGVTEARHLVDVINQTDLVEDIDEESKLGQPMININTDRDFGRLELFVLPYFRERTFPGHDGRLRAPLPVNTDTASFESGDGKRHTDLALRYSHYFGDIDFAAYVFNGTSREPIMRPDLQTQSLIPHYEQMRQTGVEVQYTRDAWLWKLEAIHRDASSGQFAAATAGFEYTFFGVNDSARDIGLLVEYLYDGRGSDAPPTVFDDDLFLGTRLAFNDAGDTAILAGVVIDKDTQETFLNIEASRRFGDKLIVDGRLRAFGNARPGEASYWLENDDYMEVAVSWYY